MKQGGQRQSRVVRNEEKLSCQRAGPISKQTSNTNSPLDQRARLSASMQFRLPSKLGTFNRQNNFNVDKLGTVVGIVNIYANGNIWQGDIKITILRVNKAYLSFGLGNLNWLLFVWAPCVQK